MQTIGGLSMYPKRELFSETPLALVAAEIRFTDSARLRKQETIDTISIALEDRFPIARSFQQVGFKISPGERPAAQMPPTAIVTLTDATYKESVSLTASSLTYETTHYSEFPDLLTAVQEACRVLIEAKVRPAIERIGLRYIDEVRVPEPISDVRQWSEWIDHRLVDHLAIGPEGCPVAMTQGLTTYALGGDRKLNFQFAALNGGPVVASQVLTRRRPAEPGPFFVLDFDGFEAFGGQTAAPLDPEVVGNSLTAVHKPIGEAFQRSITDKARELFRGGLT